MKFKGIKGRWLLYGIILAVVLIYTAPYIKIGVKCTIEGVVNLYNSLKTGPIEDIVGVLIINFFFVACLCFAINECTNIKDKTLSIIACILSPVILTCFIIGITLMYLYDNNYTPKAFLNYLDKHFSTGEYKQQ